MVVATADREDPLTAIQQQLTDGLDASYEAKTEVEKWDLLRHAVETSLTIIKDHHE